ARHDRDDLGGRVRRGVRRTQASRLGDRDRGAVVVADVEPGCRRGRRRRGRRERREAGAGYGDRSRRRHDRGTEIRLVIRDDGGRHVRLIVPGIPRPLVGGPAAGGGDVLRHHRVRGCISAGGEVFRQEGRRLGGLLCGGLVIDRGGEFLRPHHRVLGRDVGIVVRCLAPGSVVRCLAPGRLVVRGGRVLLEGPRV